MCFDNKVNDLLYVIRNIGRLPEEEEFYFEDGEDERVFFDNLTFMNIINSEELETKPKYKVGYKLILNVLDEFKIEGCDELKELITERFKTKIELINAITNKESKKASRLTRRLGALDNKIKKCKKSKKNKIMSLGGR